MAMDGQASRGMTGIWSGMTGDESRPYNMPGVTNLAVNAGFFVCSSFIPPPAPPPEEDTRNKCLRETPPRSSPKRGGEICGLPLKRGTW